MYHYEYKGVFMRHVLSRIYIGFIALVVLYFTLITIPPTSGMVRPVDPVARISTAVCEMGNLPHTFSASHDYQEDVIGIMPAVFTEYIEEITEVFSPNKWEGVDPYIAQPSLNPTAEWGIISRPMGLFSRMGDNVYVDIIPPQAVEIYEMVDNWWRIRTYDGPMWIDQDFEAPTNDITALLSRHGQRISVFYKNLETGFVYTHNPNRVFFGASVHKATHALYTYIAAERGYIDMYTIHTYRAVDYWGGTGIIRFNYHIGAEFTTRELLYYSVVHSDNIAFRMLVRYMNQIGFSYRDFMLEMGFNTGFILDSYMQNVSAADMGLWIYAIHNYFESDSNYGHYFYEDMLNVALYSHPFFTRGEVFGGSEDINVQLIHSDYPVGQKYGWAASAFNVMGIVYAPSPYLLVILSNMSSGAHELFEEISWLMQDFNARYFIY